MADPDVLPAVDAAVCAHFGQQPARASVSFVGVQPIEVLRFEPRAGERTYVSLGMSRHPMTGAGASVLVADGPRAELLLYLRDPRDAYADAWRRLAVLAAAPAVEGVIYQPGMTVDLGEPLAGGSGCTGVLVIDSPIAPVRTGSADVAVLQVVPATAAELAWCRVKGSDDLRRRWDEEDTDLRDLARAPVRLG